MNELLNWTVVPLMVGIHQPEGPKKAREAREVLASKQNRMKLGYEIK